RLWEVATAKPVGTFRHPGGVRAAVFSPDGKTLATAGWGTERLVCLWDVATGKQLHELKGHLQGVTCLAFSPDGKRLASGDAYYNRMGKSEGQVRLWDPASGELLQEITGHPGATQALAFTPDGQTLLVGRDGLHFWDVTQGRLRGEPVAAPKRIWSIS